MESIDWNPVLMALIALVSVTLAPLVTLYVGNKIKQSNEESAAATAAHTAAIAAAAKLASEEAKAAAEAAANELKTVHGLVNSSKTSVEEKLELVTQKLGIAEVHKAKLEEKVKGDEERRQRDESLAASEAKAALEEKVRVAEAAVPPAPVVGTPTAAPAELPIGTAANPIPIVLQAEQVDAKADVVNVAKEGPQPDGS